MMNMDDDKREEDRKSMVVDVKGGVSWCKFWWRDLDLLR